MKNSIAVFLVNLLFATTALCQVPQINNIEKIPTFPGDLVVISGHNFSTNAADLRVWFGAVPGEIVSATNTLLQVRVPEEASFDNILVTNLGTGLTGYSLERFYTYYSGDVTFNPSEFSAPLSFEAKTGEKDFYDLCSCDLDQDGKPDIIATKFADAQDLMVLRNTSTLESISFARLTSTEVPNLNVGAPTSNVVCRDLNGDGKPDVVASRSGSTRSEVFVLQNTSTTGSISFAPVKKLVMDAAVKSRRIAIADLDFDGRPEVVVTNTEGAFLNVFVNNSTKTTVSFETTPTTVSIEGADNSSGVEIQDLNGDRKPDIIVTQFFKDNVYILKNTSTSGSISFDEQQVLTLVGNPLLNVKAADIDFDGLPDIIATNTSGNRLIIFPNKSAAEISFGSPVSVNTGMGPWGIDMADMNGDGKLDILVGNQNQKQVNVLINNSTPGSFTFTKNDVTADLNTRNVLANDFDGDGKPDLAFTAFIANTGPFRIEVLRNLNCFVPRFVTEENLAICPGQTKTLNAVPNMAATFRWFQDGGATAVKTGAESFLEVTEPGDYRVEATTEGGSCIINRTYTVLDGTGTIPGDPQPGSNSPTCEGGNIELTVQATTGAVYKWAGPNNFTSTEREPVITDVSPGDAGLYTVTIKIGDCLSSEESVAVDVVTLPVFTASAQGPVNFCEGTTNQLSVTQRSGYNYQWYNNGQVISGATGTTFNATASGNYSALVTDQATGCTLTTNEILLKVYNAPAADFTLSSTTVCTQEEIITTNTSTVDPDATPVYSWNFGNGRTMSEKAPIFSYTAAGGYNPQLTVSYQGVAGCSSAKSAAVTVVNATTPTITASTAEICPEESADLSVAGDFTEVTWSTGESGNNITVNQAGIFTVNTVDANGCQGEDSYEITLRPVPDVQVTASTENIQSTADTIRIVPGNVNLMATGADTYSWSPEEFLDDPSIAEPVATVNQSVTFYATGTLTGGCSAVDSIFVAVNTGGELPISPRKVFSPESTRNPTWEIDLSFLNETCNLTLFDDRGMKILENSGQIFNWNGTINGNPLPEGVYYYIVGCPEGGKKAGTVLLVRN